MLKHYKQQRISLQMKTSSGCPGGPLRISEVNGWLNEESPLTLETSLQDVISMAVVNENEQRDYKS